MTTYYLKSQDVLFNLILELQSLPLGKFEVSIKETGRTRRQEKYWHKLVNIVADFMGENRKKFREDLKYYFLGLKEVTSFTGEKYNRLVSTTEITKAEYSILIEKTLMLGAELGLTMPDASFFGLEER